MSIANLVDLESKAVDAHKNLKTLSIIFGANHGNYIQHETRD